MGRSLADGDGEGGVTCVGSCVVSPWCCDGGGEAGCVAG